MMPKRTENDTVIWIIAPPTVLWEERRGGSFDCGTNGFGLVRWLRGEAVNGYCDDGDFTDLCFVWKKEGGIPVLACTTESTKFCIQRK